MALALTRAEVQDRKMIMERYSDVRKVAAWIVDMVPPEAKGLSVKGIGEHVISYSLPREFDTSQIRHKFRIIKHSRPRVEKDWIRIVVEEEGYD